MEIYRTLYAHDGETLPKPSKLLRKRTSEGRQSRRRAASNRRRTQGPRREAEENMCFEAIITSYEHGHDIFGFGFACAGERA